MVCGLLPANSCEEFMYPAYYYYFASVASSRLSREYVPIAIQHVKAQNKKVNTINWKLKVSATGGDSGGRYLFSDTEFFNQLAITCKVMFLKIVKQTLTFTNQCHQAAVS